MKRFPALPLLLATAILFAAPFAAKERGWPEIGGLAVGMGSGPEPGQKGGGHPPSDPQGVVTKDHGGGMDENKTRPEPAATPPREPERLAGQESEHTLGAGNRTDPGQAGPAAQSQALVTAEKQETANATRPEPDRAVSREQDRPWRSPAPAAPEPGGATRQPEQAGGKAGESIRLFRSAAFRGSFEALPKWKRVLTKAREQVRVLNSCTGQNCPPGATSWQRIMQQAKGMERMEQLKTVNAFFNKWPYRLDQDAYGASDWWATPQEFLKLSGDCEDYAITKYFALRELGFASADLRIVVLKDRIRGIGHAVLVVFAGGEAHVLDNLTSAVFPHDRYKHYTPQYSLNEEHRWSHIPLAKQP